MFKKEGKLTMSTFNRSVLALSCFGLLVSGALMLSGCNRGGADGQKEDVKKAPMSMSVQQVDQLSRLDEKVADGQYLLARVSLKNDTNDTIVLQPTDFVLQNITNNEKDQYSQPAEKGMTTAFGKAYGDQVKDKIMDFQPTNLYPRMQLERFFVFMVPSEAAANSYQILYKPAKISTPLVTPDVTVINDHRTEAPAPNDSQPTQPNQP